MTFPADGLSAAASSRHIATWTRNSISGSDNDKGSSGFRGTFSRFPSALPSASHRFLLRRGIGAPVHDTGTNATRDFSDSSEAFRAGTDCSVLMWRLRSSSSHFRLVTATLISPFGPCSERLSTLPGDVPSDAPSWGALPFPTQRTFDLNERRCNEQSAHIGDSGGAVDWSVSPSGNDSWWHAITRQATNRTARTAPTAAEPHSR